MDIYIDHAILAGGFGGLSLILAHLFFKRWPRLLPILIILAALLVFEIALILIGGSLSKGFRLFFSLTISFGVVKFMYPKLHKPNP